MANGEMGWEIQGTFFPHVGHDGLLHGDHALMREVTGLVLSEIDSGEDPEATETAWMAVAVWHQNQEMRRGEVLRFIERLPKGAVKRVGWEETNPVPLAETPEPDPIDAPSPDSGKRSSSSVSTPADESSRSASPSTTKSSEEPSPEQSILNGSGGQPSDTGAISPHTISAASTSAAA